nr:unnamed protein product [Digitaria exilis]
MAIVAVLVAASPAAGSSAAPRRCWRAAAASSSAASGVDLKALQDAIDKKSSDDVKQALDQLRELGWAKRWSSQPYVSRRTR